MAVSARSAALRSTPGYATRAPVTSAFAAPNTAIQSLPAVPQIDDARAPYAAQRGWLQTVLTNLPGKYNPALGAARDNARAQLAGYGGIRFRDDDPNTPEREDLAIDFDPNARLGQREKNAVNDVRNSANAAGLLSSSFAAQGVGNVLTRMNEEKRAIVNHFAARINEVVSAQRSEATSHITEWMRLFGEDSRWLADNPVPTPPPPAPAPTPAPAPGAATPNRAGNIVTNYTRADLSPGLLSSLANRHPGYKAVVAGNGKIVLKKVG